MTAQPCCNRSATTARPSLPLPPVTTTCCGNRKSSVTSGWSAAHCRCGPLGHLLGRDVLDVARDEPPVSERIHELTGAIAVELILDLAFLSRACLEGTVEYGVDVGHVNHHGHWRATQCRRRLVAHIRERVRQHDHGVADLELGVTNLALRRRHSQSLFGAENGCVE